MTCGCERGPRRERRPSLKVCDPSGRAGDPGRERGAGTVLMAACCAVVLTVGLTAALVAGAAQAAASARAAADLSALAGAETILDSLLGVSGGRDPCAVAATIASRNGAVATSCTVDDQVNVTVVATVRLSGALARLPGLSHATAQSRAGPAPPSPAEP